MGFLDKPRRPLPAWPETHKFYCEECKTMESHILVPFKYWYCDICGNILKEDKWYECYYCFYAIRDYETFKKYLKPKPTKEPKKCDYCHKKPDYLVYLWFVPDAGKYICSKCFGLWSDKPTKYDNICTENSSAIYCKIKKRLVHENGDICKRFKMI